MKKNIVILGILLFGCGCINLLAQENTVTERKHIIGATVGIQYPKGDYKMGYGGDIFYRHCISSSPTSFRKELYLFVNAGYSHYESKNNIVREDIPTALGLHLYKGVGFLSDNYFNIELGALYRKEKNNTISEDVKMFGGVALGFLIPLSESLNLDINTKAYYAFKDVGRGKLSAGLSYSF